MAASSSAPADDRRRVVNQSTHVRSELDDCNGAGDAVDCSTSNDAFDGVCDDRVDDEAADEASVAAEAAGASAVDVAAALAGLR